MQINFRYITLFILIFWSCTHGRANTEIDNKINLDIQQKVENIAQNKELCDFVITTAQKMKESNVNSKEGKNAKNNKTKNTQEVDIQYNKNVIDSLVSQGADINCLCEVKETQLNALNYLGNTIVNGLSKFFLRRESRPLNEYQEVTYKHTPIYLYVGAGNRAMVDYLVYSHKADLNISGGGSYAIDIIVGHNNLEEVQWIVNLGANPQKTGLCTNNMQVFDWLLANGATIAQVNWNCIKDNEKFLVQVIEKYKPDLSQRTDFHLPTGLSPKVLDSFLSCGVKPDAKIIDHYFTFGTGDKFYEYAQIFAKYKADFSEREFFGCPLEKALKTNDMRIIKIIAENGGLKTQKQICVKNPAHWDYLLTAGFPLENIKVECLFDEPKSLALFVEKYKPNLAIFSQKSILEQAKPKTLDILFANGVLPSSELLSKLFTFQSSDMYEYAQVFIKYKQDITSCGFFGCPLEKAIDEGNLATVKLLVANGVDKKQPFRNGKTPLEHARSKGQVEIAKFLAEN
jgi:hypothetical protein